VLWGLLPWFSLMAAGLVASVVLLFWGYRSGQFADQERARYLPLRGETARPQYRERPGVAPEVYALTALMAAAGVALAVTLGIAVLR